jgi:hypothetical protein
MTSTAAHRFLALVAAPVVLTLAISTSVVGQPSADAASMAGEPGLEQLKAEARPLAVHIDGP